MAVDHAPAAANGGGTRSDHLRNAFDPPHEGDPDLQAHRQSPCGTLLLGNTKIESTVRYLGIEVDDALEIAEQVEV